MLINTVPHPLPASAPAFIRSLRDAFDERLMELHGKVLLTLRDGPATGPEDPVYVPFLYHGLEVTAVYHRPEERFTQLIAREAGDDPGRPWFSISLFL